MSHRSVRLLAVAVAATCVACAGPSGDDAPPQASFTAGEDVPVIVPGRPGEEPERISPGETGEFADASAYNEVDLTFITGMVVHHAQALVMSELAPTRASDERVRLLAERIVAAQQPEIQQMQSWLVSQGLPEVDLAVADVAESSDTSAAHEGHDHGDMVGMATPAQIDQLEATQGEDFDRLFLQLMTLHHQGALVMADEALTAMNPIVSTIVDDVVASQSAEIGRMDRILADLDTA